MAAKTKWTEQQQSAIDARGQNILVSAAAGSGKTAVLTERAVQRMLDKDSPIDADRLMVVTFTRAAAAEMKQRMLKKLAERIENDPTDKAARRQRRLLERAVIGTIDSLCLNIVQENRQLLDLPASFRMGDNRETDDLYEEAINEALERYYQSDDEQFKELLSLFEKKRGDGSLAQAIKSLLGFARSNPFYRDWMREKANIYDYNGDAGGSVWGKILLEYAEMVSKRYVSLIDAALEIIVADPGLKGYLKPFSDDKSFFEELRQHAVAADWDRCRWVVSAFKPSRLGGAKNVDEQTVEYLQALRKEYKGVIEKLTLKVFFCDSKGFISDAEYLSPRVKKLFELAEVTDDILSGKKREDGIFEFSDLQQLTVSLLVQKDGERYRLTELAKQLQSRFDEIMVDEYQDVNAVQDMIVNALSNGRNLFMVGDVKQSIYRFRQARPEIFIARSERYAGDEDKEGRLITLSGNFRSRKEIIESANNIFRPLFSKTVGEICYDGGHMLSAMASYPESDDAGVEFCVLEQGTMLAADAAEAEAEFAARRIKELIRSGMIVFDNGVIRPIKAGDIAILLRSTKNRASIYKRALENAGIEAFAALENGFLDALEIKAMLSFLRAVSNPTDDIALIGAMLSPMFDFSAEQLGRMRGEQKKGGFYTAVKKYAEKDEKTARFLSFFGSVRNLSDTADAARVISEVMEQTGFGLRCCSMENGEQRFANLLMLMQYAEKFQQAGKRGLHAFLKIIDNVAEQNGDFAPAAASGQKNAVTITSIHRSKGLEWPVVLLCDMGRDFGHLSTDSKRPTALHAELGFACARRDKARRIQFTTAQLEAVRMESAAGQLSEELRVLYVAVTRAKEKLIMTAAIKKAIEAAYKYSPEGAIPQDYEAADCKNYAQWILMALGCCGDTAQALQNGDELGGIKMRLIDPCGMTDGEPASAAEQRCPDESVAEAATDLDDALEIIKSQIDFKYPFAAAVSLPAKLSVSEITHEKKDAYRFSRKPGFAMGEAAGSDRGTAVHAYMQYCDYTAAAAAPEIELKRLVAGGALSEKQGSMVDIGMIKSFFQSKLYNRIASAQEIKREFAVMASAADCPSVKERYSHGDEAVMLQGVADCVFIKDGAAVILDYKTDRVKDAESLLDRYAGQLILYKEMVESVMGIKVAECVIWSFELGCEIKVC